MFLSFTFITAVIISALSSYGKSKDDINRQAWFPYSDVYVGGKSENYGVRSLDSCIQWTFQIKKNDQQRWPFLGISKTVTSTEMGRKTGEDSLVAELNCNRKMRIKWKLLTFDPEITKSGDIMSFRVLEYSFTVGKEKKRIAIPLKQFKVAEWWKSLKGIPDEDNRLFLDSICKIDLQVTGLEYVNSIDTITLFNLDIKKSKNHHFFLSLEFLLFPTVMCALFFFYKKHTTGRKVPLSNSIQIAPRQIETNPSDWNRILNYMENNYTDPQLSIQKVAKTLGYSDSKLSHIISKMYSSGFRGLIHELRINEGTRLLKDSEMNISEIAYKLGYATPSHFNREFKKRTGFSPTVYRKGIK